MNAIVRLEFKDVFGAYSGDTRSPFPVISVHSWFYHFDSWCKVNIFFLNYLPRVEISKIYARSYLSMLPQ